VGFYFSRVPDDQYLPTWYDLRTDAAKALQTWPDTDAQGQPRPDNARRRAAEKRAAEKAAAHANTPTTAYFDTLGRPFLTVAHNRVVCPDHDLDGTEEKFSTRVELDIEGNQRSVRDAITQAGDAQGRIVMGYDYDLLGNRIHQASMEAGERWMLNDGLGKPIRAWDSPGHTFRTEYDPLRRPVRTWVTGANPANPVQEVLTERLVYGEQHPEAEARNLRGQVYLHLDQAGGVTSEAHDFKGNLLSSSRRLATEYKQAMSWSSVDGVIPASAMTAFDPAVLEAALVPLVEAETFTSHTLFDALNRPIQMIVPRSNQAGAKRNVIQPEYNEANLLERVDVWLEHPSDPAGLLDRATVQPSPVGVENIDYDAKGQRLQIDYKNGATTRYTYDPDTFRLIHLYTRRGATFTDDCGSDPPPLRFAAPDEPPPNTPCGLQNLHYTYDPVGNITHIRDDAQQRIFFRNQIVEPSAEYAYDAIYRLIQATGREHLGQVGGAPIPHSYNDVPRVGIDWSANDGNAMGTYIERYVYDAVGNFLAMQHRGSNPAQPGWTRHYTYNEASQLEPGKQSNRLTSTTIGATTETYSTIGDGYDAHGNMLRMPQLQVMQWDYKDQLQMTQRQKVNAADVEGVARQGERTYYVYDAAGQRVRKVTELANGNLKDERIYLGGSEIYRRHSGTHAGLERESLHIMDDKQRIALVETRNNVDDGTEKQIIRYQFGNHLGSVSLELDEQAQIVSYEEYTSYGSTSYQAVRSQTETAKRYRYTGKERDDESGLYYYGARYYAPWLGRWTACDKGFRDSPNLFVYVNNNPIVYTDPDGKAINLAAAGIGTLIGGVGGAVLGAWNAKPGERWAGAAKGAAIGAGAGALAGLTFGVSLAVTGAAGIGGTAGSVLVSGTLAGAVGGGTSAAASTLAEGGSAQEAWEMASIGAFTGSVGGAVGGSTAVVTSNLARSAGTSQLTSYVLGGTTAGATGDVAAQTVSIVGGVQEEFSPSQLLVSTAGGAAGGALAAKNVAKQQAKQQRREAVREAVTNFREEAVAEITAREQNLQLRSEVKAQVRASGKPLSNRAQKKLENTRLTGLVNRRTREVFGERSGQRELGPATDTPPVENRPVEPCAENAAAVRSKASTPISEGKDFVFFTVDSSPSMLPVEACFNCQAQFPQAKFPSGVKTK
jgi:RHS repeat-associated protein